MQTTVYTYSDVVGHLLDWFGVETTDERTLRKCKRAVESAYRHVTGIKEWMCYRAYGQFQTVASVTSGTIAYDQTGGSNERMVTLSGSTWPSWAGLGMIQLESIWYPIASRTSDTIITLDVNNNPGADIAAGTSYVLGQDTYLLPVDLKAMGTIRDVQHGIEPEYVMFDDMVSTRLVNQAPTWPWQYTILPDPHYLGSLACRLYPIPNVQLYYEYMYSRRPRQLQTFEYNAGTVSTSGTTLSGTATTFTSAMVGSIIRFSNTTTAPTGTTGENPYIAQRAIASFTNTGSMVLDQALDSEVSGVAYLISDPIDIEAPSMYTAFLRKSELETAILMNRDDVPKLSASYRDAEIVAKEQDARSLAPQPGRGAIGRRVPMTWSTINQV